MFKHILKVFIVIVFLFFQACNTEQVAIKDGETKEVTHPKGALFIIGGGSRPKAMIDYLVDFSKVSEGYGIILPMASSEPDSAYYYANLQFQERGVRMFNFNLDSTNNSPAMIDSIKKAKLIYMAGGDQRKLMDAINTEAKQAIKEAFQSGSVIAGTSAGAAVMSDRMITGDEKRHPIYTPTFRTLESDNILFDQGLGLLPSNIIIDQHFIYRSRYNRLLTAILENEETIGIGIDESTALLIQHDSAKVVGDWQVITFERKGLSQEAEGKMGGKNIQLNIFLPGETFKLPK